MRVVAVANRKGGSGKTTVAVSLAAALAECGQRTLLVDLDPQATASEWLGETSDGRALVDALERTRRLDPLIARTTTDGLHVVGSGFLLHAAETRLAARLAAGVHAALRALPRRWDVVIVDCPAGLGYLSVGALSGAREVLVPMEGRAGAISGVAAVLKELARVRAEVNPELRLTGVVVGRADRTLHCRRVMNTLVETYGPLVFETTLRDSVRFAEAYAERMPVTTYPLGGGAALDSLMLAEEFLSRAPSVRPPASVPRPIPTEHPTWTLRSMLSGQELR